MKKQLLSLALLALAWLAGSTAWALEQDGDGYYLIGSKAELQEWTETSNYLASKVKLTANIDDVDFMLGTEYFTGTFDGQGHSITLNNPTHPKNKAIALFASTSGATIKNLIVAGTITSGVNNTAGLSTWNGGASTFENVVSIVEIIDTATAGDAGNGGFIGYCKADATFTNCVSAPTFTGTRGHNNGFIGWRNTGTITLNNCVSIVEADVSGAVTGSYSFSRSGSGASAGVTATNTYVVKLPDDPETPVSSSVYVDASQMASGYVAYTINTAAGSNVLYQNLETNIDAYPVPFSTHAIVYANGQANCDGSPKEGSVITYSNTSGYTQDPHTYVNGFCSVCGNLLTDYLTPNAQDYYELGSAADVKWFAAMVNQNGSITANAKLTADIDFDGVEYTPIGHSQGQKYMGEFDGQNHKIMNLTSFSQENPVGFFGYLRATPSGAAYIHNLIIDSSCNISGTNYVGGITGGIQAGDAGNNGTRPIIIENCVNNAPVTATGGVASGIVGAATSNYPKLTIRNCMNSGNISATGKASALCSWQNNAEGIFENCLNIGSVSGDGNSKNLVVLGTTGSGERRITNCYDLCASAGTVAITQGDQGSLTTATPLASGEVCARLGYAFHQNIGSDAIPTLDKSKGYVTEIKAAGWSTQYITDSDVTIPSGIEAFAGVVSGRAITLNAITEKIKAGEPVILRGNAGLYNFMPTTGASDITNDLEGSDGNVSGGDGIYALSQKSGAVGFYPVAATVTIPAGKAYLEYTPSNGSNPVKGFTFVFDDDDATGLDAVNGEGFMVNGPIFNLAGQRLNKMQKGINIVNGKKVLK